MDIVLQFGEFTGEDGSFWSDLSIQIIGSIIGAATAVWLFFRQLKFQKVKEDNDKVQLQKNRLQYLHFLLKDSSVGINKMIKSLNSFRDDINVHPTKIPSLGMISIDVFNRISNKIDQE